ncbi:hypothetical protein ACFV0R_22985 [Streptomyces sp. NPDC059578]|uniref:hypothetical protein n=1 Tax=unclassified Streptomyces TaxID=2593676 RepID=UPI0036501B10
MPTPYGSCGGLAFSAKELRVLRRALALAVHPRPVSAEDVQDSLRLAESVDEALHESARLRAFLIADLTRYRAALPGTTSGYLTLLEEVLAVGYQPVPDDLAALRALRGSPVAAALLERCRVLAERAVRVHLAARTVPVPAAPVYAPAGRSGGTAVAVLPASRARLTALPGGLVAPRAASGDTPAERPKPAGPADPAAPHRPVPTPAEVFPPRRRPAAPGKPGGTPAPDPAPPAEPPQQRAAG